MVIDAVGLFGGNRIRHLTDQAKLYFPWMIVASNGFARLEIDHATVVGFAFQCFQTRPTEAEFLGWVKEYHDVGLMFLYECDGRLWGQWDTREELLPKYKTAKDKRSPSPPEPEFSAWKQSRHEHSKSLAKSFGIISETFLPGVGVGIGIGTGIGTGKHICPSASDGQVADGFNLNRPDRTKPIREAFAIRHHRSGSILTPEREAWFSTWWSSYWLHKSKKAAQQAFGKHVRTPDRLNAVMAATLAQAPEMLAREPSKRPHGATWLNGARWEDELLAAAPPQQDQQSIALARMHEQMQQEEEQG